MTSPKSSEFLPRSGDDLSGYASMISALSLSDKQKMFYRAAQGLDGGREALETWSRKDLLQLVCLEMGKDRKFTGVSKSKMVEHLLNLVTTKGVGEGVKSPQISPQSACKRQRKGGRPARIPSAIQMPVDVDSTKSEPSWLCRNTACRALVPLSLSFCQRCSCCICQNFDDNKDPSLWIVCTPEPHDSKMDCKLSCHILCAINKGFAGVVTQGSNILDGSYRCCSCGKVSSLIGCWKKQLSVARDARRVDTLCQRLSLCYRLLNGTCKHKDLHKFVEGAIQKLQDELGPVMEGSANFARGLVNRLSSSREVIELINLALERADNKQEEAVLESQPSIRNSDIHEKHGDPSCTIEFNKVCSSSISLTVKGGGDSVIGYRIWHRIATDANFPDNPTCIIPSNTEETEISNLVPCTEYDFYVVPFSERGIGEPSETSCCTMAMDDESTREFNLHSHDVHNAKENVRITQKLESNFKVRELGKVLHSTCTEPSGIIEGIFHGKGVRFCNIDNKNEERKSACVRSDENFISSPGEQQSIDDVMYNHQNDHKTLCSDLNVSASEEPNAEEQRLNLGVEDLSAPTRTVSQRDSTELVEEIEAKSDQIVCAEVTELGETSDPGNSQTSHKEETEDGSQIVSHALQKNTMDALHHDAESWAMQVRNTGTTMLMESQSGILSKRTIERFSRDGFGLVNGCGGTSMGGSLCSARNYEFCVKIVRWLECQGYLKEDFRMKFLTWFSLRASEHEKRVVSVFIDTLQDNPASLAGQLVDTFSEIISLKRHQMVSNSFCNKVWH